MVDLVKWANLIHHATTRLQEPAQGEEWEHVAVAEEQPVPFSSNAGFDQLSSQ